MMSEVNVICFFAAKGRQPIILKICITVFANYGSVNTNMLYTYPATNTHTVTHMCLELTHLAI